MPLTSPKFRLAPKSVAQCPPDVIPVRIWLASQLGKRGVTPATTLDELEVDSLDWLHLTVEIEKTFGVRLTGDDISRITVVRDLEETISGSVRQKDPSPPSPLDEPEEFLGDERLFWLRPLGPCELAIARNIHALNWLLVHAINRVSVSGLGNVPTHGPFVLAPHHVSYLDAFVLSAVLDFELLRTTYWAAWTGVGFGPIFRVFRRLTHVVPVDSSRGAASCLAYGAAVLRSQSNLIWFPEGRLSLTGELLELKPGIGILLDHYPVPVVPVHIEGTHKALPPGHRIPRPGRMQVTFEAPLDPRTLAAKNPEAITNALQAAMAKSCAVD